MPLPQGGPPPMGGGGGMMGGGGGANPPPPQPMAGQQAMLSQPTGQEQASDPKVILTSIYSKILDLMDQVNTQFPGGEDQVSDGLQQIGMGFQEKIQRMGTPEPPGPPIAG